MNVAIGNEFFENIKMQLSDLLDGQTDFDNAFSCKWTDIESAFMSALGKDSKFKCLSAYLTEEKIFLGGKTIEATLYEIESHINKTFGTPLDNLLPLFL